MFFSSSWFNVGQLHREVLLAGMEKSEFELELFSSNYFPRAGAGAFRLQYLLPELELELLGSETFHRAGSGVTTILLSCWILPIGGASVLGLRSMGLR